MFTAQSPSHWQKLFLFSFLECSTAAFNFTSTCLSTQTWNSALNGMRKSLNFHYFRSYSSNIFTGKTSVVIRIRTQIPLAFVVYKNVPSPACFVYFRSFQSTKQSLRQFNELNHPYIIGGWYSNSRPFEHEAPPITTRPGPVRCCLSYDNLVVWR